MALSQPTASSESPPPEIEFAGLKAQYAALRTEIDGRMAAVVDHGRFIMGPEVAELETALAAYVGVAHAVGVSSGTDALLAPLMAYGVGPGDAVFMPAFTFTATAEVAALLGAQPVFVDVGARSFNLDLADLERRIAEVRKTGALMPRAVIAVDLFGLPADYEPLAELCDREGLHLIADAAQSMGARYHGRPTGALAPVTATSFFPAKPLGCFGDGGAVFTDDDGLAAKLRSIRVHGAGTEKYDITRIGLNARLDTLQAAVLLAKLPALDGEIAARQALADRYDDALQHLVETPERQNGANSAWAQYSILTDRRDALAAELKKAGIPVAIYYPRPLHLQPAYRRYAAGAGDCPVSEGLCERILSLPMHGYMSATGADRIVEAVADALATA